MARDFTKNTSNYMTTPIDNVSTVIAGASAISIHALVTIDAFTGSSTFESDIIQWHIASGSRTGGTFLFDTSGDNLMKAFMRAERDEAGQTAISNTALSTGTEYALGCLVDYGGDSIEFFLNGASDGSTAVTFLQTTYTSNNNEDEVEGIGANMVSGAPSAIARQLDGGISELAIWNVDIGTSGWAQLGARFAPPFVKPQNLVLYWRLIGSHSPEVEIMGGNNATINGTVAARTHAKVISPTMPYIITVPTAAAPAAAFHPTLAATGVGY